MARLGLRGAVGCAALAGTALLAHGVAWAAASPPVPPPPCPPCPDPVLCTARFVVDVLRALLWGEAC
jgi:hypothetical protein